MFTSAVPARRGSAAPSWTAPRDRRCRCTARTMMLLGLVSGRQRDDFAGRRLGVIGVDQQGQVLAPGRGKLLERGAFCRRTRMNECAMVPKIDAELVGQHGSGAGETREVARARRQQLASASARGSRPKSTSSLLGAASTMRAASAATIDWNCRSFIGAGPDQPSRRPSPAGSARPGRRWCLPAWRGRRR